VPDRLAAVRPLFTTYRILAFVVGVALAFCALVAAPLKYLAAEGTSAQDLGESLSILWALHGTLYMVYVLVALMLAYRARWSVQFTALMLVAGLVPLLMFFVEHRVAGRMRAEHPELA
jgi:integral membrane protein